MWGGGGGGGGGGAEKNHPVSDYVYCVSRLVYWAYPEYILGTSCAHPGHIWKKYKTYLEHFALNSGHASCVPWPYIGYILVVFWAFTVDILGIY